MSSSIERTGNNEKKLSVLKRLKYKVLFGDNVNHPDENGCTLLHKQCYSVTNINNDSMIKMLIDAGANVNAKDNNGDTPLHLVYQMYTREVKAKCLISAGADVNIRNNTGKTPLHIATKEPNCEDVKLLIDSGSEINIRDANGKTALLLACENRFDDLINLLLECGADPNIPDNEGKTPLHVICLLSLYSLNFKTPSKRTGEIDMLVRADADVNKCDIYGRTPLHYLCSIHDEESIRFLAMNGANLFVEDSNGVLPEDIELLSFLNSIEARYGYGFKPKDLKSIFRELSGGQAIKSC